MLQGFFLPVRFNKALADLGLGSVGLEANVHQEIRLAAIQACKDEGLHPRYAAACLFTVWCRNNLISPSHRRVAASKLDLWAARQDIPDPDELFAEMEALFLEDRSPENGVELLCLGVHRVMRGVTSRYGGEPVS